MMEVYRKNFNKISNYHNHKEIVSVRAGIRINQTKSNSIIIYVSIGEIICDLLKWKVNDVLSLNIHNTCKNLILLKPSNHGSKLQWINKSNFKRLSFTMNYDKDITLYKTTISDFDIICENNLVIDIANLKRTTNVYI